MNMTPTCADGPSGDRVGRVAVLNPLQRARWMLAVLAELAAPSEMELVPVLDPYGRLVDFEWIRADPLAAMTLGCPGQDLIGKGLRDVLLHETLGAWLFDVYRSALHSGQPQMTRVQRGDWCGQHAVRPSAVGVLVVITSASRVEQVIAAQRALRGLEPQSTGDGHNLFGRPRLDAAPRGGPDALC
jgi:hypothetical protein